MYKHHELSERKYENQKAYSTGINDAAHTIHVSIHFQIPAVPQNGMASKASNKSIDKLIDNGLRSSCCFSLDFRGFVVYES